MLKLKKVIASLGVVAILSTLVVSTAVSAGTFGDVPASEWYAPHVEVLVDAGVLDSSNANFRPGDTLNRAEALKLAIEVCGNEGTTDISFPDVSANDWFYAYVQTGVANGIVNGNADGTFAPQRAVNRAEFSKMVVNACDLPASSMSSPFSDVKSGAWYHDDVITAYAWSIVDGYSDGTFRPDGSITRAASAKMSAVAMDPVERSTDSNDSDDDDDTSSKSDGALTVDVGSDPSYDTVPKSATAVELLNVEFSADDEDVEIDGITFHKTGISDLASGFQGYLYEGADRLTSGKSVNSSSQNMIFSNLNIKVEAGKTRTLTLKADIGATSTTGSFGFEIEDGAVDADTDDVSGLPVKSKSYSLSTTAVGTATVYKNGTAANPKVGEDGATVAKFKISAATEAAQIEQFGLYVGGTISPSDIANFKLYVSGQSDPVAEVDGLNSKGLAQFVLDDPYEIEKGGTKSFYATADFNTGRSADTVKSFVDESTDVVAVGDKYGFGMQVTTTSSPAYDGPESDCTATSSDCTYLALEGGDITITSSGPAATDISVNSKDVTLMDFTISSVSDVTFKNFQIALTASEDETANGLLSSTTANFTDIKVINTDTGKTLLGPIDSTSLVTASGGSTAISESSGDNSKAYYLFTDEFEMSAGEKLNLAITTDVANETTLDDQTLTAELALGSTYPQIRDVNNKTVTNTTSLVPSSAITGKVMTTKSSSLTLALASSPSSQTFVKGTSDVKFAGYSFACGSSSACKVTDLTLTGYIDDDGDNVFDAGQNCTDSSNASCTVSGVTTDASSHYTYLNAYVGSVELQDASGNVVAAAQSVQTDGTVTYTNVDWNLDAGETQVLYVVGDISSNAYANNDAEGLAFGIAATTNVTAEDEDGNTISSITGTPNATATGGTPTAYMSTSNGGTLKVDVDAATPKENIVVAGSTDVEAARYKFTTTTEAFTVKKLAISNRQTGAITSASNFGDNDDNVSKIKISYTNSDGVTETKNGFLTNGNVEFSGLDFHIDKDDSETLSVYVDVDSIVPSSDAGADEGTFIELNFAFNNFEALGASSGSTYKAGNADNDDDSLAFTANSDLSDITFTDPAGSVLDGALSSLSLSTSFSFDIDDGNGAAPSVFFPNGTLVCFSNGTTDTNADSDTNGACVVGTDNIAVITGRTSGSTEDTYTAILMNDDDGDAVATNSVIYYAIPGTDFLTTVNRLHVYETQPTVSLASSSPSGSRNVSTTDDVFIFNVTAASGESVKMRAGAALATSDGYDGNGSNNGALSTDTDAGDSVDGSSVKAALANYTDNDSVSMILTGGDLSNYSRVAWWMQYEDGSGNGVPTFAQLSYNVTSSATADPSSGAIALSQSACSADAASPVTTEWYFCDVDISSIAASSEDDFHIQFTDLSGVTQSGDFLYIDQMYAYNDKLVVDISSDGDLDTYANNSDNAGAPVAATLREGGTTYATGYVSTTTNGASATSTASVTFIPSTEIEVAKGTTKTYTVRTNTSTLLHEDSGVDDPVTFKFDTGTASEGSVTAGDFWWHDTNFSNATVGSAPGTAYATTTPGVIKWLGHVSNTTVTGNTLQY